jgi:predicted dehydrogenase
VSATYGAFTGHAVEDNAVVVAGYENGSVGVAEASFVTTPGAFAFEVRGTEGTLLFGLGREELIGKGGRFGETWTVQELSDPPAAPFALWVDAIEGRADTAANVAAAIDLTRLVAAANASASEHRVVDLDVA